MLKLSRLARNPAIAPSRFTFTPPKGADIIVGAASSPRCRGAARVRNRGEDAAPTRTALRFWWIIWDK